MQPRVIDNDNGEIIVSLHAQELRGWSYANDAERRAKMVQAHEYAEGWWSALSCLKSKTDLRLNDYLCEMKPGYDDSIVGFNEAWDIVRDALAGLGCGRGRTENEQTGDPEIVTPQYVK